MVDYILMSTQILSWPWFPRNPDFVILFVTELTGKILWDLFLSVFNMDDDLYFPSGRLHDFGIWGTLEAYNELGSFFTLIFMHNKN